MLKSILLTVTVCLISMSHGTAMAENKNQQAERAKFFANQQLQAQRPEAFVLQPKLKEFLVSAHQHVLSDAEKLLKEIAKDEALTQAINNWESLSIEQQLPWLKRVFELEIQTFGVTAPKLLIDNHSYPGRMVYFDFDLNQSAPGAVYLNPDKLKQQPKFASLAFLLHETRHSFQLQLAAKKKSQRALAFKAAFAAQKSLKGFSFSDFLTLANEYEAFLFGNYVLGKLTHWRVDMPNMGTFASQFDSNGKLKIDLIALSNQSQKKPLIELYNLSAERQFLIRNQK